MARLVLYKRKKNGGGLRTKNWLPRELKQGYKVIKICLKSWLWWCQM